MHLLLAGLSAALLFAQQEPAPAAAAHPVKPGEYNVEPGTRIPLNLINSVSTRNAAEGDRVYLETAFPIVISGRIVIPPAATWPAPSPR